MIFFTLRDFEIETNEGVVALKKGMKVKIDTVEAFPLIEQGYISPFMNPDRKLCHRCNVLAWRYCAGYDCSDRFTWGWWCLECRPYTETERN